VVLVTSNSLGVFDGCYRRGDYNYSVQIHSVTQLHDRYSDIENYRNYETVQLDNDYKPPDDKWYVAPTVWLYNLFWLGICIISKPVEKELSLKATLVIFVNFCNY